MTAATPTTPIIHVQPGLIVLTFGCRLDGLQSTPAGARNLAFELWRAARDAERSAVETAAEQRRQLEDDLEREGA